MPVSLSRRNCLKSMAAGAAALLARAAAAPAKEGEMSSKKSGAIDAHVHVWTSDTKRYPLAPGYENTTPTPISFTPEELFAHADPCGVHRVNLIQMSFYGFDNSYMLDSIQRYPDRFVGTAVVDPYGPDAREEMLRLADRKCRAFRIHPSLTARPPEAWLQPKEMDAMFAVAAKHRLALSCLIDPDALGELDRMCRKYPEAPVIVDHLCRIGASDRFPVSDENVSALVRMAVHRSVYVKIGAFYALGKREPPYLDLLPMIQRVVEAFTPQRCMWETDCPFQVQKHTYEDSLALIRDRADFLCASDKEAILRGTCEGLLFGAA